MKWHNYSFLLPFRKGMMIVWKMLKMRKVQIQHIEYEITKLNNAEKKVTAQKP